MLYPVTTGKAVIDCVVVDRSSVNLPSSEVIVAEMIKLLSFSSFSKYSHLFPSNDTKLPFPLIAGPLSIKAG